MSDDAGDSSDASESRDDPELGPPITCGEVVASECATATAVTIDTVGRFVLGGAEIGPVLRVVDGEGTTQWEDTQGQRGGYAAVAVLPGDRIVGVGATGMVSSGELSGFARGYDHDGDLLALVADTGELVVLDEELDVQWSAPVISDYWSYTGFFRGNIVVAAHEGGAAPVALQWFSPTGDLLWTLEHPSPTAPLYAGQLTVDGERLWVRTVEIEDDGCLRPHFACVAHEG